MLECQELVIVSETSLIPLKCFVQLPDSIGDFKLLMAEAGRAAAPRVTISDANLPNRMWYVKDHSFCTCLLCLSTELLNISRSHGGVVLSALGGKIMLSQTVDE